MVDVVPQKLPAGQGAAEVEPAGQYWVEMQAVPAVDPAMQNEPAGQVAWDEGLTHTLPAGHVDDAVVLAGHIDPDAQAAMLEGGAQ